MSGWLPPGCTDDDIDRAAPGYDERRGPITYLARNGSLIICFEADNEDDAIDICNHEGWIFEGEKDDDGQD